MLEVLEERRLLATFIVDTRADQNNGLGTGGVSLRDAIEAANASPGSDTIRFASDLTESGPVTLTLPLGYLLLADPTGTTSITGPGAALLTLDGNNAGGIFRILAGSVQISGVTITGGNAGSQSGGGILNSGTLTITDSIISNNRAAFGGGIANLGTLTITSSTISGNLATNTAPTAGLYEGGGGGIQNMGTLEIQSSTISDNTARRGGGIQNITHASNSPAPLTVISSTISGNTARYGAGIDNIGQFSDATVTLINSTVSANHAESYTGGISNNESEAHLVLRNSTIAGNTAAQDFGGIWNDGGGSVDIANTLIADNRVNSSNPSLVTPDFAGIVTSRGNNIVGVVGGSGWIASDRTGSPAAPVDPKLGPLADNGGPTKTMALLPGSPAINAGSNMLIPHGVNTDQRGPGFGRIQRVVVDIGAFEADLLPPKAKLARLLAVKAGKAPYRFKVAYTDHTMVDIASIGHRNIRITGPNKFKQWARMVSKPVESGSRIVVTYQITAPGRTWGPEDDGRYTIWLWARQVRDVSGNASPKAKLGVLNVAVKPRKAARAVPASRVAAEAVRFEPAAALPAAATRLFNSKSLIRENDLLH